MMLYKLEYLRKDQLEGQIIYPKFATNFTPNNNDNTSTGILDVGTLVKIKRTGEEYLISLRKRYSLDFSRTRTSIMLSMNFLLEDLNITILDIQDKFIIPDFNHGDDKDEDIIIKIYKII